jgi:hypothetical protein
MPTISEMKEIDIFNKICEFVILIHLLVKGYLIFQFFIRIKQKMFNYIIISKTKNILKKIRYKNQNYYSQFLTII